MTLPFLIAGLILDLAGKQWFNGAQTVGAILIIVGAVGLVIQLVAFAIAAHSVRKQFKRRRSAFDIHDFRR